jgi:hypothetical protein
VSSALTMVVSTWISGVTPVVASPASPGSRVSLGTPHMTMAATSTKHPAHNTAPKPDYVNVCVTKGYNSRRCIKQALAAIRHVRSDEHMKHPAMILPRNYRHLTVAKQTFVITDLERVARDLTPFQGLTSSLDRSARLAAVSHLDPTLVTGLLKALHIQTYGSNWASDDGPLSADYDWMYKDGYAKHGGINLACLRRTQVGCWGHRANILWPYDQPRLLAGAATATPPGTSIAEVLTGGSGPAPTFVYTWKAAIRHGANRHRAKAH